MKTYVYKIKNKEALINWARELKSRTQEAVETLEEENVLAESISFFEINGETYGVGIMVGKEGGIKPPNMEREINQKHFQVLKESIGDLIKINEVYTFKNL